MGHKPVSESVIDKLQHSSTGVNTQPVQLLPDSAPPLRVYLQGRFTMVLGDRLLDAVAWNVRKAHMLVKLLALTPGHRLHRARVLDLFWPDLELEAFW
jgi:hypothetical protein